MSEYRYPKLVEKPKIPIEARAIIDRSQAIERWGSMREKTVQHFKFTPWTSFLAIFWAGIVPLGVYSLIKWDMRRKDKNKGITPRRFL